jgi:hypothetical protein
MKQNKNQAKKDYVQYTSFSLKQNRNQAMKDYVQYTSFSLKQNIKHCVCIPDKAPFKAKFQRHICTINPCVEIVIGSKIELGQQSSY